MSGFSRKYDRYLSGTAESGYAAWQADELARAKTAGARGIKILKTLGLYLREKVTAGRLVTIDDRRFDPMWEACGRRGTQHVREHHSAAAAGAALETVIQTCYQSLRAHPS